MTPLLPKPNRLQLVIIIGAASLFFATIEYLIPKPVPFFRIGLSNLPLLLALPILRVRELSQLFLIKIIGQGLLGGTLASYVFLFSSAGTLASLLSMYLVWRLLGARVGWIGLACIGALASNAIQVWFSIQFIFGQTAWIIIPLFLGLGFVAGLLVGIAAVIFAQRSNWYGRLLAVFGSTGALPGRIANTASPSSFAEISLPDSPSPKRRKFRLQLPRRFDFMSRIVLPRLQLLKPPMTA